MANPAFLSFQEITDQIISALPPQWKAGLTGKVLKRLIVAIALSTEAVYALAARVLRLSILATSEGDYLRNLVRGWGMSAFDGVPSSGYLRFIRYGETLNVVAIPQNTVVGAVYGQQFRTTQPAVLGAGESAVDVPAVCLQPGTVGNVLAGEVVALVTGVAGVDSVTNPNSFSGGADAEGDAAIKARVPGYLDSLHRGTIPATEYAIGADTPNFPEVSAFITERSYGVPGYFRAVLADFSGGDVYRARNWVAVGNGVYFIPTALSQIDGLVAADWPCKRFGIVVRTADGKEVWQPSNFVAEVEAGNWRFCHDKQAGRLYARADGGDLNDFAITIVSGVVSRALATLEEQWAGNGIFCDVIVPFAEYESIALTYVLEPGYNQQTVETGLRTTATDYASGLGLGVTFELEGLYSRLALVAGAAGVLVTNPVANVAIASNAVFRPDGFPVIVRRS